jgi:hypothetical protein
MSNVGGMISLQSSVRSCQVNTGWADKLQSDRIFNPSNMLCPVWQGVDTSGRLACSDSYWTKNAGCDSAADRIAVENALRPQYIEYVTLDAQGIKGLDCGVEGYVQPDAKCGLSTLRQAQQMTGEFGYNNNLRHNLQANCHACQQGVDKRAYVSQSARDNQWLQEGYKVVKNRGWW